MNTTLHLLAPGMLLAQVAAGFALPDIATQPQGLTNAVGTTATFWVVATGTEPLAHQWRKYDYFGNFSDLTGCTETNLVLTNVQTSHAGDYRVVVTNIEGAVTSAVARLTVIPPPAITNQPKPQAVAPGATATFTVGTSGTGPLTYQWQRNVGAGFSDFANRTNAVLTLTNAQTWDAWDYRVIAANLSGACTSTVAHLYVMSPALLTNRVVIDNFNDNRLTGWSLWGPGTLSLIETTQQLVLRGYWPGVVTHSILDSFALGTIDRAWSVAGGKTLEWRVDLVAMNDHATARKLWLKSQSSFFCYKGRDYVMIGKLFYGPDTFAVFSCEPAAIRNTNLVLCVALTLVQPNVICTTRILDRDNPSLVLYQRSVVDTPLADPTISTAEFERLSGMRIALVSDVSGPPCTSGNGVGLDVWQYNDGTKPMAEAIYDNLELWTYRVPIIRYVDANSASPTPPYTNWITAAHVIQDAVDAALAGDEVVVTNGLYATGGRAVGTNVLVNRVAVDKPLTLRSVNGQQFTVIQGRQVPGTTNGDGAIRCVYLANGASLFGFTLTNGATRTDGDYYFDNCGGGVGCESVSAVVSNCVLTGNSAQGSGGGASGGTLNHCTLSGNLATEGGGARGGVLNDCVLTGNTAGGWGGGAADSILSNCAVVGNSAATFGGGAAGTAFAHYCELNRCTLMGNSARNGGGADWAVLKDCILTCNSASETGGGTHACVLNNSTLVTNSASQGGGAIYGTVNNCIVYFNTAIDGPNYSEDQNGGIVLNHCCTTSMPTNGIGNITNAPLFVDYAGGNLRLQASSPCINAGLNAYASGPTDLDGNPRIVSGTVDIGAYEYQGSGSVISYAWLQRYSLPTDGSADATDPDRDGHSTWQEWRCQTDPTNALSVLRLLTASPSGTNVAVTWQSVAGVNYFLERSTNLAASPVFTPLAAGIPGQVGTTTYTDTDAARLAPLFYRVGVGN